MTWKSNRFGALENLDDDVDIKRAWENTRAYKSFSYRRVLDYDELKQHE
jgi:hypothetical protein